MWTEWEPGIGFPCGQCGGSQGGRQAVGGWGGRAGRAGAWWAPTSLASRFMFGARDQWVAAPARLAAGRWAGRRHAFSSAHGHLIKRTVMTSVVVACFSQRQHQHQLPLHALHALQAMPDARMRRTPHPHPAAAPASGVSCPQPPLTSYNARYLAAAPRSPHTFLSSTTSTRRHRRCLPPPSPPPPPCRKRRSPTTRGTRRTRRTRSTTRPRSRACTRTTASTAPSRTRPSSTRASRVRAPGPRGGRS